jgi:DNA-directed RNA polymerase specialized sigma24 family protein
MMLYWKTVAIDCLLEYEALEKAAAALPRQLGLCRVHGGGDERLNATVRRFELEERLRESRKKLRRVQKALQALTPQEKLLLRLLYMAPGKGNSQRLCELLGCEQATVYRRRDSALRKFAKAMYGSG